jgi:two-component system, NtrC family, nitrogen regulation sensor histidine kinase NtrY
MISKRIYLNIIVRIVLITVISVITGFLVATKGNYFYPASLVLLIIILAINLIIYLNTTNRRIQFFFDAVRNEDSNLSFPSDPGNKSLKELYLSMNNVSRQIQQLKIENRQQEQYFQTLIEHLAIGIITFNRRGFILHANSTAKLLLSTDILTHIQQVERINRQLFQVIKTIRPSERRLVSMPSEKGEIQLSIKASALKTRDEELTIVSIQDIKNELDEKEVDSWMKLIRVLMHEIMNSITPITSLSESLLGIYNHEGMPAQPHEITEKNISTTLQGLNVIREQGKGLMSFVESYRKLTRIPQPERNVFKVSNLFTRIQILFNSLDNSDKIKLTIDLKEPELELYADENLISLVLINLLKNAIEANADNSTGMISVSAGKDQENNPVICVTDNGPGIPLNQIDEIFVPFFTTRKEGSGIGLSISKQIMRLHGGNLKVRSLPGKETIFCMSFRSE